MKTVFLAAMVAIGVSASASADEVWTSGDTEIVYELDEGSMAVLSFDGTTLYIDGLGGEYENRGTYHGIWMLDEPPAADAGDDGEGSADGCGFAMMRPGKSGETSNYWGQVEITFIDTGFPSVWIGYFGDCFDGPSETMIARPVTGQ